jgi:hypothetical protein
MYGNNTPIPNQEEHKKYAIDTDTVVAHRETPYQAYREGHGTADQPYMVCITNSKTKEKKIYSHTQLWIPNEIVEKYYTDGNTLYTIRDTRTEDEEKQHIHSKREIRQYNIPSDNTDQTEKNDTTEDKGTVIAKIQNDTNIKNDLNIIWFRADDTPIIANTSYNKRTNQGSIDIKSGSDQRIQLKNITIQWVLYAQLIEQKWNTKYYRIWWRNEKDKTTIVAIDDDTITQLSSYTQTFCDNLPNSEIKKSENPIGGTDYTAHTYPNEILPVILTSKWEKIKNVKKFVIGPDGKNAYALESETNQGQQTRNIISYELKEFGKNKYRVQQKEISGVVPDWQLISIYPDYSPDHDGGYSGDLRYLDTTPNNICLCKVWSTDKMYLDIPYDNAEVDNPFTWFRLAQVQAPGDQKLAITMTSRDGTESITFDIKEAKQAQTIQQQIKILNASNFVFKQRIEELEQTIKYAKKNIDTRNITIEQQKLEIIALQEKIKELQQYVIAAVEELANIQTQQNTKTSTGLLNKTFNLTPDEREAQKWKIAALIKKLDEAQQKAQIL